MYLSIYRKKYIIWGVDIPIASFLMVADTIRSTEIEHGNIKAGFAKVFIE